MSYEFFRQLVITRAVIWVSNYGAWVPGTIPPDDMPRTYFLPMPPLRWR